MQIFNFIYILRFIMRVLLKKQFEDDLSCKVLTFSTLVLAGILSFILQQYVIDSFVIDFLNEEVKQNKENVIIFSWFVAAIPSTLISFVLCICYIFFIDNLRENVAYKVEKIREGNKLYTVKYFERFKKYYYNGKLHREKGVSISFYHFGKGLYDSYYLNGVEIKKEEFLIKLQQNRISEF